MTFLTRLQLEEWQDECWTVLSELVWDDGKRRFTVPRGFITDLDSVPRLPVVWLLLKGRSRAAAVLHDWLYSEGLVSRTDADRVFLDAMRATAAPLPDWLAALPAAWATGRLWSGWGWLQRRAIWAGVRLFGRRYFRQMREDRL